MQRGRRPVRLCATLAGLVLLEACSWLVDSSGLTARDRDGSHVLDDASASEASAPAVDGESPADVAASTACGAGDYFEDFEGDPRFGWTPIVNGPALASVDGVRPHDGQRSLHLSKLGSTQGGQAVLNATLAAGVTIRSCSFDMYVDLVEGTGSIEIFKHIFAPSSDDTTYVEYAPVVVQYATTGSFFQETLKSPDYQADSVPVPELDTATKRWFHVETRVADDHSAVDVGGVEHSKKLVFQPPRHGRETLLVGMNFEGDGNRWEIFVDNLCCKTR